MLRHKDIEWITLRSVQTKKGGPHRSAFLLVFLWNKRFFYGRVFFTAFAQSYTARELT